MQCKTFGCNRRGKESLRGRCSKCYKRIYVPYTPPRPIPSSHVIDVEAILTEHDEHTEYLNNLFDYDVEHLNDYLVHIQGQVTGKELNHKVFGGNRTREQLERIRKQAIREGWLEEVILPGKTKSTHLYTLVQR